MIRLSTVIETFEADFLTQYRSRLRPEHYRALAAIKCCRTASSLKMQLSCSECPHQRLMPHSCGHRHCPHCQHHESQQWLGRQMKKQAGGLPLSKRQDRADRTARRERRRLSLDGLAAFAAQGFQAGTQLRLSAPQLQAFDRLAAGVAQIRSGSVDGIGEGTATDSVFLLRGGDAHRQNTASLSAWRYIGADCRGAGALIM